MVHLLLFLDKLKLEKQNGKTLFPSFGNGERKDGSSFSRCRQLSLSREEGFAFETEN